MEIDFEELPEALGTTEDDYVVALQDGVTKKVRMSTVMDYVSTFVPVNWLAFMDMTDPSIMHQNANGTDPVTTSGQRIGRFSSPTNPDHNFAANDGPQYRWLLDTEPNTATGFVTRVGAEWLDDVAANGWFDQHLLENNPWWMVQVVHMLSVTEQGVRLRFLTTGFSAATMSVHLNAGATTRSLVMHRTPNEAVASADAITDGPVALSFGYTGSAMTVRVNLEPKVTQANANALPSTSTDNGCWIGDHREPANHYAIGFMDHYPSEEEEEAAIRQALATAGL